MLENVLEKNEYKTYEKKSGSKYNRRSIEGKVIGCSRCVGYCKYKGHPGFLTDELRKEHNCFKKGCHYYISKPQKEKSAYPCEGNVTQRILQIAIQATADYEGMKVINISEYNDSECVLRYATVSNCYPIKSVEDFLSGALELKVRLEKIDCDFDVAAKLIFSL